MRRTSLVLVAALLSGLVVGSYMPTAEAAPPLGRKLSRVATRGLQKALQPTRKRIALDARGLRNTLRASLRDVKRGRLTGEDAIQRLEQVCQSIETFAAPVEFVEGSLGFPAVLDADAAAVGRGLSAALDAISNTREGENRERSELAQAIVDEIEPGVLESLREDRRRQLGKLRTLKAKLEAAVAKPPGPEVFEFRRRVESHSALDPSTGETVALRRPGIRRLRVDENGRLEIDVTPAFDEPDSFIGVDLKDPRTGSLITSVKARQRASSSTDEGTLAFAFDLPQLPPAGTPTVITVSGTFDESLLPVVDAFDCLVFLFPGPPADAAPSAE